LLAEGGRGRVQCLAGDGLPLVAPLVRGWRGGAWLARLFARPLEPAAAYAAVAPAGCAAADLCGQAPHRLGPRLLAAQVGHPHSTVSKVLRRHGLSRPPRPPREPAQRYEWPCPGDLLHMDVARYARFTRPGHAVTGDRSQRSRRWMDASTRVGYDYAHAIVDDHSRLACVELLDDERAPTVTAFLERALAAFAEHGITTKRLITDNAWAYTHNRSLRELLASRRIRQLTTAPYRPRTNGKVERFHQTMAREWAAFRRNTAERVYAIEAAHNPEVAGSNPAPATEKGSGNQGLFVGMPRFKDLVRRAQR
jgi:transposase InsO family protein